MRIILIQILIVMPVIWSSIAFSKNCTEEDLQQSDSLLRLAKSAKQNSNYEKSIQLTQQSIHICPSHKNWHWLAILKENNQSYQGSLDAYLKAVALAEDDAEKLLSLIHYSETAFMHGNLSEARYAIRRVKKISGKLPPKLSGLLQKIEKELQENDSSITRGFDRINTSSLSEKLQNILKYEKVNIYEALNSLARNNDEIYGKKYFEEYHSYINQLIFLQTINAEKKYNYENSRLDQLVSYLGELIQDEQDNLNNLLVYLGDTLPIKKITSSSQTDSNDPHLEALSTNDYISLIEDITYNKKQIIEERYQVKITLLKFRALVTQQLKSVGISINKKTDQKHLDQYIHDSNHLKSDQAIQLFQAYNAFGLLDSTEKALVVKINNLKIIGNIISQRYRSTIKYSELTND